MTLEIADGVGFLGAALMLFTFCQRIMMRMRMSALPRCKGVFEGLACFVGVQSCVRPVCAVMTAGPDGFRGRGPILLCGLRRPGHYGGLFSSPVRPVRHHFTWSSQPLRAIAR